VIWFAAMSTLVTGAFGCIATLLEAGVRRTLEEFARLEKEGRLDARELG